MYKVLIVEDERIERESLCRFIMNSTLSINEVESCDNGEDGLLLYEQYQPDIIIADINMPKMNGLDMIEKIRESNQEVLCLVLTSYDYFSYAQRAIRLNVEDFILKPADKETLTKALTNAITKLSERNDMALVKQNESMLEEKMRHMQQVVESECFYSIMTKQSEASISKAMKLMDITFTGGFAFVVNEKTFDVKTLKEPLDTVLGGSILGNVNAYDILFITVKKEKYQICKEILQKQLQKLGVDVMDYAFGSYQERLSQLYQSYEDALYQLQGIMRDDMSIEVDTMTEKAYAYSQQFLERIEDENLYVLIHEFTIDIMSYEKEDQQKLVAMLLQLICKNVEEQYHLTIEIYELYDDSIFEDPSTLELNIAQIFQKLNKIIDNLKYQNQPHLMKKAMQFIEKNYQKTISLNDLAEELHVSSFYISKLFSKEGRNFTEIVNDLRIKEAKKLILEDYAFKETAAMVGFGSQSYFTKIFKKKVGMSPKEYRNLF